MKHAGVQTRIGVVVPGLSDIKQTVNLTKTSKQKLKWMDFYEAHSHNARLTCRHFGIHHRTFYRYYNRFKLQGLAGLESHSHRPQNVRQPLTPRPVVDIVRSLRKSNPEYSKYKLSVILKRDHGYSLSASSIGRIISRYNLFATPVVKPKGHPHRLAHLQKQRKPKNLKPTQPGQLLEVDVKHLPSIDAKRYAFVAIDVVSKQASVHVSGTISSAQGAIAWHKAVHKLGLPQAVLTDNGSENMGAFAELLHAQPTQHYWARPHTPKDKPHVERLIGTIEKECIQWGGLATNLADQQNIINTWLNKYHSYRPHQSLGYLTPDEYQCKIRSEEVALII